MNKVDKIITSIMNKGLIMLAILVFSVMIMPMQSHAYYGEGGYNYNYGGYTTYSQPVYQNYNYQTPNPTVSIYANPSSVNYNGSSTITWNSNNANYCNTSGGTNGWSGNQNTSGTFYTGTLTNTTTYYIVCTNNNGQQANASVTVYVNNINYQQNNYQTNPNVTMSADQTNIGYNQSTVIRWYSNNATSCTGSGGSNGWAGAQNAFSGSFNTGPLLYTTTYTISCSNYNYNYGNYNNYGTGSVTIFVGNQAQTTNNSLTATTTEATQISQTSAQLNSVITNSGNDYTTNSWFEWGTTMNLGNKTATTPIGISPSIVQTNTISGLSPGTTYYFRAVAENSLWRNIGSILSFTTTNNISQNTHTIIIREPANNIPTTPTSRVLINSSVDNNQPIVSTIDNTKPHPGDEINYTVNYQNFGTGIITGLIMQITLPQEVSYLSSNPNNAIVSGNTLIFNLGTLQANGQGTVTAKMQIRNDATSGTNLNFPVTLSYIDPSKQPQSINTNASAQVWSEPAGASFAPTSVDTNTNENGSLGANVFGVGFLPTNLSGWFLLIVLILLLILIAKYLLNPEQFPPSNKQKDL